MYTGLNTSSVSSDSPALSAVVCIESTSSASALFTSSANRLERQGSRHVAKVVEYPLDLRELALDRPFEAFAVIGIVEHFDDQLAAVADVLDRMGEVVDEADRDTSEQHLSFCLADVLLQFHEAIGHVVEGEAELTDLVGRVDDDPLVEPAFGQRARGARSLTLLNSLR
jgi:hypothetical protein